MEKCLTTLRIKPRVGLFFVMAPAVTIICLSAVGERFITIVVGAAMETLLCLAGGVAYLHTTRARRALRQKRGVLIAALLVLLSVSLTQWPLHAMFYALRPALVRAAYAAAEDQKLEHTRQVLNEPKSGMCRNCWPWRNVGGSTVEVQKQVGPFFIEDCYVAETGGSLFMRTQRGTFYVHQAGLKLLSSYFPGRVSTKEIVLDQNFAYRY